MSTYDYMMSICDYIIGLVDLTQPRCTLPPIKKHQHLLSTYNVQCTIPKCTLTLMYSSKKKHAATKWLTVPQANKIKISDNDTKNSLWLRIFYVI